MYDIGQKDWFSLNGLYVLQMNQKTRKQKIKIVLLGNSHVGKTSIITKYVQGHFTEKSTVGGIDFLHKDVTHRGISYRLQLWDTASQERFLSLITRFIKDANFALIVFDVKSRKSLDDAEKWLKIFKDNVGQQGFAFAFLVANKIDYGSQREVMPRQGLQRASELKLSYFETSAKTGQNLDEIFLKLIERYEDLKAGNYVGQIEHEQYQIEHKVQEIKAQEAPKAIYQQEQKEEVIQETKEKAHQQTQEEYQHEDMQKQEKSLVGYQQQQQTQQVILQQKQPSYRHQQMQQTIQKQEWPSEGCNHQSTLQVIVAPNQEFQQTQDHYNQHFAQEQIRLNVSYHHEEQVHKALHQKPETQYHQKPETQYSQSQYAWRPQVMQEQILEKTSSILKQQLQQAAVQPKEQAQNQNQNQYDSYRIYDQIKRQAYSVDFLKSQIFQEQTIKLPLIPRQEQAASGRVVLQKSQGDKGKRSSCCFC